jgi:predicted XRE-type DNA-binding protein
MASIADRPTYEEVEARYAQTMSARQLDLWMKHMAWSRNQAAEALGLSRATIYDYLSRKTQIPRTVALACSALMMGARGFPPTKGQEELARPIWRPPVSPGIPEPEEAPYMPAPSALGQHLPPSA